MNEIAGLPWLLPGLLLGLVVALALGPRIGRTLGTSAAVGVLLVVSIALIVAATLTPQSGALVLGARSDGSCDLTIIPPWLSELLHPTDITLNVLLFVPLGVALGLLPRSSRRTALVAGAVLLPFVIESVQLVAPVLDRACEANDVADNLVGLAVGLLVGWVATRAGVVR